MKSQWRHLYKAALIAHLRNSSANKWKEKFSLWHMLYDLTCFFLQLSLACRFSWERIVSDNFIGTYCRQPCGPSVFHLLSIVSSINMLQVGVYPVHEGCCGQGPPVSLRFLSCLFYTIQCRKLLKCHRDRVRKPTFQHQINMMKG